MTEFYQLISTFTSVRFKSTQQYVCTNRLRALFLGYHNVSSLRATGLTSGEYFTVYLSKLRFNQQLKIQTMGKKSAKCFIRESSKQMQLFCL